MSFTLNTGSCSKWNFGKANRKLLFVCLFERKVFDFVKLLLLQQNKTLKYMFRTPPQWQRKNEMMIECFLTPAHVAVNCENYKICIVWYILEPWYSLSQFMGFWILGFQLLGLMFLGSWVLASRSRILRSWFRKSSSTEA